MHIVAMRNSALAKASPSARRVEDSGFQSIGTALDGGAGGMKQEASQPSTATATATGPAQTAGSKPPATCPSRIATKVAPSTNPVPSSSSFSPRC